MRIRLKNFRCYEDRTFEFGEHGVNLLSGVSGSGKSTVVMGVHFALFGTGKKVVTYGKTSCRVELDFGGMRIVRTRSPNRLVLDDVYEDQAAQDIISERVGSTFDVTGYIAQNALNSFVLMSPIDKLSFLERFTFRDVDLNQIKSRCKALIGQKHDEQLGATAQLVLAREMLEATPDPDVVEFPVRCRKSQRSLAIKNEETKLRNCEVLIRRAQGKTRVLRDELSAIRVLNAVLRGKQESIDDLSERLSEMALEDAGAVEYDGDARLGELQAQIVALESCRELVRLETQLGIDRHRLEEMALNERQELETELAQIDGEMWGEYSRADCEAMMAEYRTCISDMERVERHEREMGGGGAASVEKLRTESERLRSEVEGRQEVARVLRAQREHYRCPECSCSLRLKGGELCSVEGVDLVTSDAGVEEDLEDVERDVRRLRKELEAAERAVAELEIREKKMETLRSDIESILSNYEDRPVLADVRGDLEYIRGYLDSNAQLEKRRAAVMCKMEREGMSRSCAAFAGEIEEREEQVTNLRAAAGQTVPPVAGATEAGVREEIRVQQAARDRGVRLARDRSRVEESRHRHEEQLRDATTRHLEKYKKVRREADLVESVDSVEKELDENEATRAGHEAVLDEIARWKEYDRLMVERRVRADQVEERMIVEKECVRRHAAATLLREKILEAESVAITNIIGSIDTHASIYLDSFFPEHPLTAQLLAFKTTKKGANTKPQINLGIHYKGMECDITTLSGGELARVVLAYTLALAEMFNTPLLMLDECTASLDEKMTEVVFEGIRENFRDKMVLAICHQSVEGAFDSVVDLV